jgi:GTPase SAR1 family protein
VRAFCSREAPEVFHAIAHRHEIWRPDPLDVPGIHEEARDTFARMLDRASTPPGLPSGRILLLLGEAGAGKTHLMRAFRNATHRSGRGYCGYLQMTSATNDYGRYILNNLIDSLDQPYYEPHGSTTGLSRLSNSLAEAAGPESRELLERLRGDDPGNDVAERIDALADRVVVQDRFDAIDYDLVRALLYLQRDDPRVKSRVLKYLRCELLSPADRALLGGLVPRVYADAAHRLLELLGRVMWTAGQAPLVLLVDQLEDMFNLHESGARFRRAMAELKTVTDNVPSSIVAISCLEDFYVKLSENLTRSVIDRIENDPAPVKLKGPRERDEVYELIARRLEYLDEACGVEFVADEPVYPIPTAAADRLVGMRTRDVLEWCRGYRERCARAGEMVEVEPAEVFREPRPPGPETTGLEQSWNDFRSSYVADIPSDEGSLASLLAWAVAACSDELEPGRRFTAEGEGNLVPVETHGPDGSLDRLMIGVCNKSAKGGHLGNQVTRVLERAGDPGGTITPVIVRSTAFPNYRKSAVVGQLAEMIARGGRKVVVEDSDWRAMLAFRAFAPGRRSDPTFAPWLRDGRPLSRLASLRAILDLDHPGEPRPAPRPGPEPAEPEPPAPTPVEESPHPVDGPSPPPEPGAIFVGHTEGRLSEEVALDVQDFMQHATFLGASGSGKTTLALSVVEQLLLRGIPAILVDRKGDLCGYARESAWSPPQGDPRLDDRRRRLRESVDVAVFTPGHPEGRPLSISVAPAGVGNLASFEREQTARFAAAALAGMMNYGKKTADQAKQGILATAIGLLAEFAPDSPVTLDSLVEFLGEGDPSLINAIDRLDPRHIEKLDQDLLTLRLSRGNLLSAAGEPLEAEALLGLGPHARTGKTRLCIVSTKFLGGNPDIQFWVAQLLMELARWLGRSPSSRLQAVALFDEADLYLPAVRVPPTKEPMENLLRRARSGGLGLLLASQSPGDFDYKGRDQIRNWFVGRVQQDTAIAKLKPLFEGCRLDVASRLPARDTGEFFLLREGQATPFRAAMSLLRTEQLPDGEILELARRSRLIE